MSVHYSLVFNNFHLNELLNSTIPQATTSPTNRLFNFNFDTFSCEDRTFTDFIKNRLVCLYEVSFFSLKDHKVRFDFLGTRWDESLLLEFTKVLNTSIEFCIVNDEGLTQLGATYLDEQSEPMFNYSFNFKSDRGKKVIQFFDCYSNLYPIVLLRPVNKH